MKTSDVADLVGKECVLLESGRGMIVRCLRFYDDESRLHADLEVSHSTAFAMNRIRLHDEPAIANWESSLKSVGEVFSICQPQNQVFRDPSLYLHFSSPYGGTRLFFLSEYVEKVRRKDAEGWEWEDLMRCATEADETHGK